MTTQPTVRVRMAPSPTGYFHLGSARTALFNWLFARHSGGVFILRIEDTDQKRYVPDALQDAMDSLRWLGLQWDEGPEVGGDCGPYFQSQRLPIYKQWAEWLIREGHAYRCYCSEERLKALRTAQAERNELTGYDLHCRYLSAAERAEREASGAPSVVRFAMPLEGQTSFVDIIRETKPVENRQIVDPILLKSDGFPTYHLGNVIDDHLMGITHILRGDEWLNSLPLHVNLYRAFGWEIPVYAHLPLILDPSGTGKLSKRKKREDGEEQLTFIREYQEAGYLPEAMFNFLAILGWSFSPDADLFTRDEAVAAFDLTHINPAPGALPLSKLEWMNGHYIRSLSPDELVRRLLPALSRQLGLDAERLGADPALQVLVPHIQPRLKTLNDAAEWIDFAFVDGIEYAPEALIPKKMDATGALAVLDAAIELIENVEFDEAAMDQPFRALADRLTVKAGQLFGILRVAITGKEVAPPIFGCMLAIGRERTLERCRGAAERLALLAAEA